MGIGSRVEVYGYLRKQKDIGKGLALKLALHGSSAFIDSFQRGESSRNTATAGVTLTRDKYGEDLLLDYAHNYVSVPLDDESWRTTEEIINNQTLALMKRQEPHKIAMPFNSRNIQVNYDPTLPRLV